MDTGQAERLIAAMEKIVVELAHIAENIEWTNKSLDQMTFDKDPDGIDIKRVLRVQNDDTAEPV
jgi:hypothetical protein